MTLGSNWLLRFFSAGVPLSEQMGIMEGVKDFSLIICQILTENVLCAKRCVELRGYYVMMQREVSLRSFHAIKGFKSWEDPWRISSAKNSAEQTFAQRTALGKISMYSRHNLFGSFKVNSNWNLYSVSWWEEGHSQNWAYLLDYKQKAVNEWFDMAFWPQKG